MLVLFDRINLLSIFIGDRYLVGHLELNEHSDQTVVALHSCTRVRLLECVHYDLLVDSDHIVDLLRVPEDFLGLTHIAAGDCRLQSKFKQVTHIL